MCHQAIEKMLKALIVELKRKAPSKSHNLRDLAKEAGLKIPKTWETFLFNLNPHYILSRYPDVVRARPYESYNRRIAQGFLKRTGEFLKWLEAKLP
jgi:HEPN domain-containing protein